MKLLIAFLALFLAFSGALKAEKYDAKVTRAKVVLELFTSQGCSSCPPADRLLAELQDQDSNVLALSYHVDYWNYLGWKDPYSSKEATELQRYLAGKLRTSVFTPQLIVDGEKSMVGSKSWEVKKALKSASGKTSKQLLSSIKRIAESVSFELDETSSGVLIHLVSYEPQTSNSVPRGENAGRTLKHIHSVRWMSFTKPVKGQNTLRIPQSESKSHLALLIRDKSSYRIIDSLNLTS